MLLDQVHEGRAPRQPLHVCPAGLEDARKAVETLVERFDRRGTEPFELLRSEFGQNSVRIKEILLEF